MTFETVYGMTDRSSSYSRVRSTFLRGWLTSRNHRGFARGDPGRESDTLNRYLDYVEALTAVHRWAETEH